MGEKNKKKEIIEDEKPRGGKESKGRKKIGDKNKERDKTNPPKEAPEPAAGSDRREAGTKPASDAAASGIAAGSLDVEKKKNWKKRRI